MARVIDRPRRGDVSFGQVAARIGHHGQGVLIKNMNQLERVRRTKPGYRGTRLSTCSLRVSLGSVLFQLLCQLQNCFGGYLVNHFTGVLVDDLDHRPPGLRIAGECELPSFAHQFRPVHFVDGCHHLANRHSRFRSMASGCSPRLLYANGIYSGYFHDLPSAGTFRPCTAIFEELYERPLEAASPALCLARCSPLLWRPSRRNLPRDAAARQRQRPPPCRSRSRRSAQPSKQQTAATGNGGFFVLPPRGQPGGATPRRRLPWPCARGRRCDPLPPLEIDSLVGETAERDGVSADLAAQRHEAGIRLPPLRRVFQRRHGADAIDA